MVRILQRSLRNTALVGTSALALLANGTASAQARDGEQSSASEASNATASSSVADIVVTAQKRSQRLQDVPVAVAAVQEDVLIKTGVSSTATLPALVPGLTLNATGFAFRPFLRGVGTSASNGAGENSVSTYIDNIYITSLQGGLLDLANIEAVEVLKGPQGTLFGRNATGGVIQIKTKDPSHTFGGRFIGSYANYDTATLSGYVTGGLTDTVAADVAVYYKKQADGWGINSFNGNETNKFKTFTVRSKVLFTPTDRDRITLAGDYTNADSNGAAYRLFPGSTEQWGPPASNYRNSPMAAPGGSVYNINVANDPFLNSWFAGASLVWEHELPFASLSSFTAYRKSRIEAGWQATPIPVNASYATYTQPEHQFSQEFQVSSLKSSPVQWIVGAYYLSSRFAYAPFVLGGLNLGPVQQQFRENTKIKSPAIYGQFTAPVPALGETNVTGGLRYTIDKRSINGQIEVVPQADPTAIPVAVNDPSRVISIVNPTDAEKTFRTFTWRLAVDHHFGPDTMIYASYNRGFKAGTFDTVPPGGRLAKPSEPEFLDAYVIGIKNTLFNGSVTLNVEGFYYKYNNLQVTIFNQTSAVTANAGAAEIKGVDLDINAQLSPELRVTVGAEVMDPKFTDYQNGPILTPLTLAQGGGVTRTFGDLTGNRLPFASKAVINGGAFYKVPLSFGDLDANVNASWNKGYSFEPSDAFRQGAFLFLDASMGLTVNDRSTRISVFGRNLTNRKVVAGATTGANPGGYLEAQYQAPRTYGVSLSHDF